MKKYVVKRGVICVGNMILEKGREVLSDRDDIVTVQPGCRVKIVVNIGERVSIFSYSGTTDFDKDFESIE